MQAIDFVRDEVPRLFARGLSLLRDRANGDARTKTWLEDVLAARGTVRVEVEGQAIVFLTLEAGELAVHDEPPAEASIQLAVAVPPIVIETAVQELARRGELDGEELAIMLASLPSGRAQAEVGTTRLDFHVIVTDVPDLGEAIVKVGLNAEEPPRTPRFTATVRYEDVEDLHEGTLDPQKLLMGGRVRFGGDYVPALQLGLKIASIRR